MTPEPDNQKTSVPEPTVSVGGGVVVSAQPEEVAYPLRREEFDMLCEGEGCTRDERWRDVLIAVAATALVGLCALVLTVDWRQAIVSWKWVAFIIVLVQAVLFVSGTVISIFLHLRVRRQAASSGYARVKSKIDRYFR